MMKMVNPNTLIAAALVLAGCAAKDISYQVHVVTSACDGSLPMEDVTRISLRVTGPDFPPLEVQSALSSGELVLPQIPAGEGRVIEVRGLSAKEGEVLAWGRSAPFSVPESLPVQNPPEISVFLRRVNAFTPASTAADPTQCSQLAVARAGHTATLLQDGRVLIAGGFQTDATGGVKRFLSEAETFDPTTGIFTPIAGMSRRTAEGIAKLPRAFHTATPLENGQVLLTGGRDALNSPAGASYAVRSGLLFDPPSGDYVGYFNLDAARSHHAAVKDRSGRVLIVGGWGTGPGSVVDGVEYYDPVSAKTLPVTGTFKRVDMGAAVLQSGALIAVAGGSDGVNLTDEIAFFSFDDVAQTFVRNPAVVRLKEKRRAPGVASIQNGQRLLLTGGFGSVESADLRPVVTSEIISSSVTFVRQDGPAFSPRGDACIAALADGRAVVIGGRVAEAGQAKSVATAEIFHAGFEGADALQALPPLPTGRHFLTCTALPDGTVLVLGGVSQNGTSTATLQDAFIFTPPPLP